MRLRRFLAPLLVPLAPLVPSAQGCTAEGGYCHLSRWLVDGPAENRRFGESGGDGRRARGGRLAPRWHGPRLRAGRRPVARDTGRIDRRRPRRRRRRPGRGAPLRRRVERRGRRALPRRRRLRVRARGRPLPACDDAHRPGADGRRELRPRARRRGRLARRRGALRRTDRLGARLPAPGRGLVPRAEPGARRRGLLRRLPDAGRAAGRARSRARPSATRATPRSRSTRGSVRHYVVTPGGASSSGPIRPAELEAYDGFGIAVAYDGDQLFVGATGDDDTGDGDGAVYVFDRGERARLHAGPEAPLLRRTLGLSRGRPGPSASGTRSRATESGCSSGAPRQSVAGPPAPRRYRLLVRAGPLRRLLGGPRPAAARRRRARRSLRRRRGGRGRRGARRSARRLDRRRRGRGGVPRLAPADRRRGRLPLRRARRGRELRHRQARVERGADPRDARGARAGDEPRPSAHERARGRLPRARLGPLPGLHGIRRRRAPGRRPCTWSPCPPSASWGRSGSAGTCRPIRQVCGLDLYTQAFFIDPGAGGPLHTAQSNGLRLSIGY